MSSVAEVDEYSERETNDCSANHSLLAFVAQVSAERELKSN